MPVWVFWEWVRFRLVSRICFCPRCTRVGGVIILIDFVIILSYKRAVIIDERS